MTVTILPPNRTTVEEALELGAARLDDLAIEIPRLWDPATCPVDDLRLLAWAFSVDDWSEEWPEAVRREVVARAVDVHRLKGTKNGIKAGLAAMGYGSAEIIEWWQLPRYGKPDEAYRARAYGHGWAYGDAGRVYGRFPFVSTVKPYGKDWAYGWANLHWADYWVWVEQTLSQAQRTHIEDRLGKLAPVRCRLRGVFSRVRLEYGDGLWVYGGDVAYGGGLNVVGGLGGA